MLLKDKENHFKDQREKRSQQIQVVLRKLVMPETIFALIYIGITVYNINVLFVHHEQIVNGTWQLTKHLILTSILLILVIIDMALRVSKLNSQVYNVDTEVKKTLAEFENTIWDNEKGHYENEKFQKEFSFYQDCFTLTFRNKRWHYVPSNTLATGDKIRLLPGAVAPAHIK